MSNSPKTNKRVNSKTITWRHIGPGVYYADTSNYHVIHRPSDKTPDTPWVIIKTKSNARPSQLTPADNIKGVEVNRAATMTPLRVEVETLAKS